MTFLGLFIIFGLVPSVYFTYRFLSYFIKNKSLKNYSKSLEIRKDLLSKIQKYNDSILWSEKFTPSKVFNEYKKIVCQHDFYEPKRMNFYNKKLFELYKEFVPEWKQKLRKKKLSDILD